MAKKGLSYFYLSTLKLTNGNGFYIRKNSPNCKILSLYSQGVLNTNSSMPPNHEMIKFE